MLTAEILYPDALHGNRVTKCIECSLSYRKKDWQALADAWKLKYFKLTSSEIEYEGSPLEIIICHNCLFEILKDLNNQTKAPNIQFKILTKTQQIELEFEQNQLNLQTGTMMDTFLKSLDSFDDDDTHDTDEMPPREGDSPDWWT